MKAPQARSCRTASTMATCLATTPCRGTSVSTSSWPCSRCSPTWWQGSSTHSTIRTASSSRCTNCGKCTLSTTRSCSSITCCTASSTSPAPISPWPPMCPKRATLWDPPSTPAFPPKAPRSLASTPPCEWCPHLALQQSVAAW